jgi:ABC-2 type transport system permease protein
VRDNQIILPKPVSSKTFTLSRLLHIFIHINKIILPMSLAGLIYISYNYGFWAAFTFLFTLFLLGIFCILIINMVYLAILRVTSPQRFKTIISYVQIAMTVIIYGLSQILPRMTDLSNALALDISTKSWRWAIPSYWFARGWKFFSRFETGWEDLLGAGILLVVPAFSIWFVVKFLAPSFARKLASLGVSADEGSSSKKPVTLYKPSGWTKLANRMATLLTNDSEERVGFLIVWNLSGRLRDFKMKVYPGIGYIVVIFGFMIYNTFRRIEDVDDAIKMMDTGLVLGITYVSGLLLLTAVNQLQFSDNFKASWFYLVAPVSTPGHIISGALKAAIAKFYLPVVVFVAAVVIYLFDWRAIPNLILGFSNVILSCLIISMVTFRSLPFSSAQSSANQTGMMLRTFGCMAIATLIGAVHYFIYSFIPVVIIGILLSVIASWLILGSIKKRNWLSIRSSYDI